MPFTPKMLRILKILNIIFLGFVLTLCLLWLKADYWLVLKNKCPNGFCQIKSSWKKIFPYVGLCWGVFVEILQSFLLFVTHYIVTLFFLSDILSIYILYHVNLLYRITFFEVLCYDLLHYPFKLSHVFWWP